MYTMWFPFVLSSIHRMEGGCFSLNSGDRTYSMKPCPYGWAVSVTGFDSEQAAAEHIDRLWSGFMWLLLKDEVVTKLSPEKQKVSYPQGELMTGTDQQANLVSPNANMPDGVITNTGPAVFPTEKKIVVMGASDISITVSTSVEKVLHRLIEGANLPRSHNLIKDTRLRTALDLYGAYFTESSSNARFLTLIMALETLSTHTARSPAVLLLLEQWGEDLKNRLESEDLVPDDRDSLLSLQREVLFKKEDSIRRAIYRVVLSTLKVAGDKDAEQVALRARKLYDLRSMLVHEGTLPEQTLAKATSDAKRIVQRVLMLRYQFCVS